MLDVPTADLRSRLLESALAIIAEQGASALTVRAVAKAAGCSTMGVYTHFSGKSGLLDAVVASGFEELDRVMGAAWERTGGGRDGLIATAEAYLSWALASPAQFQTMFAPAIAGYDPSDATRERTWETFFAHRARVAAALDNADADPAAFHTVAARLWACAHGHIAVEMLRQSYATAEMGPEPVQIDLAHLVDVEIARAAADVGR